MAYRTWTLPPQVEGESGEDWCCRAAESIPAEDLMVMVVAYLDRREKRRRSPTWSVIGDMTCHGSGVSAAIAARFRREEKGGE